MDISAITEARNSLDDQRDGAAEDLQKEKPPHSAGSNGASRGQDNENKFQSAISAWRSESWRKALRRFGAYLFIAIIRH